MFDTFIIFEFFIIAEMSFSLQYCTGLDKYLDSGCSDRSIGSTDGKCVCTFSVSVLGGQFCGNYKDTCRKNPWEKNEKCSSGTEYHICECTDNFHNNNCQSLTNNFHSTL